MIKATRLSTIRFIREVMSGLTAAPEIGLQYVDWDDHADITKLPSTDLIGLNGFGIADHDREHEIFFGVVISTYNDPNLFRMVDFTDAFYRKLLTGKQFKIYDPDVGDPVGVATMLRNSNVAPVSRNETRAAYAITAAALVVVEPDYLNAL